MPINGEIYKLRSEKNTHFDSYTPTREKPSEREKDTYWQRK